MTNFHLKRTSISPLFSKFLFLVALFFTLTAGIKAQTYQLNSDFTSGQTVSTCGGNFYDSGGSGATYSINENYTITFCSNSGNAIKLTFSAFDLESGYDFLKIYDGPTTASAARHTGSGFTGTGSPNTITSSGNCLTLQFTSDNSVNNAGFAAAISCVPIPTCTCQKQVLYNTDFEVNTANWTSGIVGGSGTVPITIYSGGPTGNYVGLNYTDSYSAIGDYYLEQRFNSIIAGRTYTFSADLARHSAGTRAFMRAEFYNASNVLLSSTPDQYATTLFPTFIPFSLDLVAPIGATSLRVVGFANSTALKIDNAKLITCFEPIVQFSNINNTSFCSGGTASFTATLSDPSVSVTYQWQSSTDGTTWTDISGATTSSYTSNALTFSTFFRVKATPSGIGCSTTTSNPVRATILAPPSVNAGIDQTTCPNTSVNLAAMATNADIFQIRGSHVSGKYLDVTSASMANGANVMQFDGNNGADQKWRFIPTVGGAPITTIAAGRYYIQNMNSGLYLYPENNGTANNTPVEQGGTIGLTTSHQWDLTNLGGGLWRIASVSSSRSLDIAGASTSNNVALQLYDYSGAANQKFYIEATAGNNYTYAWDNGLGAGANKSVSPSNITTYTVTATDFKGCSASDAMVVNMSANCTEVCNNNRDDDGDGFIDCADSDCNCTANTFPCDSKMYMLRVNPSDGNATNIEELNIIGNVPNLTTLYTVPYVLNAMAYFNGYLYAMSNLADTLYRMDKLGNIVNLGKITNLPIPNVQWSGATCDRDGNFYIIEGVSSPNFRLYKIPLLPGGNYTATQIIGSAAGGAIALPNNPGDIAIDENGVMYAYTQVNAGVTSTNGGLYTINLTTGSTTKVGSATFTGTTMGSLFPSDNGKMYGYGYDNQATNGQQNTFFEINKTTSVPTTLTSTGTTVNRSDGCSCPWRVTLQRSTTTVCTYPGSTFNWDFTVRNQTGGILNGIAFRDTLDSRFSYNFNVASVQASLQAIYGNSTSVSLSSFGGGTNNVVSITGMVLPLNSTNFSLSVLIAPTASFTPNEIVYQQAYLKNLPSFRGTFESSDYPVTSGPNNDASPVSIYVPIVQITAGANASVCEGQSINFTATDAGASATYAWNFGTGATPATSTSRGPVNVTYATSGTQTATLNVTVNGCTASTSTTVTVNSTPSVSALPNQTICTGGTAILTASVSGGSGTAGYQWQESTDNATWGNVVGGTGTTSLSYTTAVLTGNKYYRIIVTQSPSTCSATSTSALITVVADPTINVTTTAGIVCNGGAVTLNATPNGGTGTCSIQWQSSPTATTNWTNISGETNATYTPSNLSTSLRYRAQITCSGNGCCN